MGSKGPLEGPSAKGNKKNDPAASSQAAKVFASKENQERIRLLHLKLRENKLREELFLSYADRKEAARVSVEKALDASLPVTQQDFDEAEFTEMIL